MDRRSFRRFAGAALHAAAALPLLLVWPRPAAAQMEAYPPQERYVIRVEYREFRPNLSGEITHGAGDVEGTPLDLESDLGFADERTWEIRAAFQVARGHKIRLAYTPLDYVGEVEEADRSFIYGGTEFERFDRIASSFKGGYYGASYEWDLVKGAKGYLGLVLGGRMLDIDAVVAAPDEGLREVDTLRAPAPAVGAATRLYAGRISFEGELLFGFGVGGNSGNLVEYETSARLHISDRLAVQGGYRGVSIEGEDGLDKGDITFKGWQFGLELSL